MVNHSIKLNKCKLIITQNEGKILKDTSIFIEDGRIVELSKKIPAEAEYVFDCEDNICIPGLINTHTHAPMSIFRGYADDLPLNIWLNEKIWPLERKLKEYHCYIGALLSCIEMIKNGVTLFVDMYFNPLMTAKAAAETGLKAIISIGVFDFNDSTMRNEMIKSVEEYLFKVKIYEPKIIGSIGPHAPYTCSEELLLKCKDIAEKENRLIHIHLAETLEEQVEFEEKYGKREVEFLDNLDFLSSNVIAAHCVWLNKNEIRILGEHNVKISHCPISNLKLAVGGVLPLSECLKNNVTISLGTDSAASNNSLNMFEVMKCCALIHKHHTLDPSIAPANLIFDFATINGAKATNYVNSLGKIVENAPADLVLLNVNSPNIMPIHSEKSVYSNIVYSNISSSNIHQVIIDGEIVCLNGKLTKIDETRIYQEINKVIKDLLC